MLWDTAFQNMNIRNIDHIFVSRFGVFVVETENMQG
ncbi:nuclease-related domain-containing protein [Microbulbifer sp. HZ11]